MSSGKQWMLRALLALPLLAGAVPAVAGNINGSKQSGKTETATTLYQKFDAAIRRFLMGGMDSTYVSIPSTSWEIPLVYNLIGTTTEATLSPVSIAGTSGTGGPVTLNSIPHSEVGTGIGYHGLDLVLTKGVGDSMTHYFSFDYYDNAWGLHIVTSGDDYTDDTHSNALLLSGYIALKGSRYSYPAAYYGNYIQKRSAGSPIISFWYQHRSFYPFGSYYLTDTHADITKDDARQALERGTLTAGYGYNWAIADGRAVINASACAGIVLPQPGLASVLRCGGLYWFNEHLRTSVSMVAYGLACPGKAGNSSKAPATAYITDLNLRCQMALTFCF